MEICGQGNLCVQMIQFGVRRSPYLFEVAELLGSSGDLRAKKKATGSLEASHRSVGGPATRAPEPLEDPGGKGGYCYCRQQICGGIDCRHH